MSTELTVTSTAAAVGQIGGPLPLVDLAAVCRAAASLCGGVEGRDHDLLTATYTVRDRVQGHTGFPELAAVELGDDARVQVAAALCRAVYGRVPADPMTAALLWQRSMTRDSRAAMLGQMLTTAAAQVAIEAANLRAAALLGVDGAVLDGIAERA
jgi:hypothetical protein